MKKEIFEELEIPSGVEIKIGKNFVEATGKEGTVKKELNLSNIDLKIDGKKIIIGSKKATRTEKKMIYTILSHVKNLINGVQKKYEYKMKICFNHFPITIDLNGKEATIKNFLGEKIPRKAKIVEDSEVKINKDIVIVTSKNREAAGQTAANFEIATKIRNRDRRVFQDGIFITSKCGKDI
jgi:large subunit ribosomal protein L6